VIAAGDVQDFYDFIEPFIGAMFMSDSLRRDRLYLQKKEVSLLK